MAVLEDILQRHPVWLGGALKSEIPRISTGYELLDKELPGRGWPAGALIEILGSQVGIGELQLVLPALAALTWAVTRVVWLAPPHLPYTPALAAADVNLPHIPVVLSLLLRAALKA